MPPRVFIDGRVVAPEEARVSVLDRGFLWGDSVVEVLRSYRGRLVDLAGHLERLERSARQVHMPPPARAQVIAAIDAAFAAAQEPDARIRIVQTRGVGDLRMDLSEIALPSPIVVVEPIRSPGQLYEVGVTVAVLGAVPAPVAMAPAIKSGSGLGTVLALAAAREAGADDGIRTDAAGHVVEATTSNVFAVIAGEVVTPPRELPLLPGVTRDRVLSLCREHGVPAYERTFGVDQLRSADEVFLTSSIRGVVPVCVIDGAARPVGNFTRHIMRLYRDFLESL